MQIKGSGSSFAPKSLSLRSGLRIDDPQGRLLRFSDEEYDYYDGIIGSDADRIEPLDVLVTWSVNSNIYRVDGDPAAKLRAIHRGLATRCNPILPEIPEDADLLSFDPEFRVIGRLLREAIHVTGVGIPVAVKVLHRKRRNFIPMLDTVLRDHYLSASETESLNDKKNWNNKALLVTLALKALADFRADLRESLRELQTFRQALSAANYFLSPVRILEILVWTELRKVYRS